MIVGYACRVRDSEPLEPQLATLRAAGCETIFEDRSPSGISRKQPGLAAAIDAVSTFDSFVVCRVDRLGNSVSDIVALLDELVRFGVGFRAIEDGIDTTAQKGRFELPLLAALAAVDRARRDAPSTPIFVDVDPPSGRTGRKPKLNNDQVRLARKLIEGGELRHAVAQSFGVSLPTLRAALRRDDGSSQERPGDRKKQSRRVSFCRLWSTNKTIEDPLLLAFRLHSVHKTAKFCISAHIARRKAQARVCRQAGRTSNAEGRPWRSTTVG